MEKLQGKVTESKMCGVWNKWEFRICIKEIAKDSKVESNGESDSVLKILVPKEDAILV